MKKYVKPALYCERFQLTEMIAGNCQVVFNSTKELACQDGTLKDPNAWPKSEDGKSPFTNTIACEYEMSGYCYWNGTSDPLASFTS